MRVWQFSEQPYYPAWDERHESLRNTLPNSELDPAVASQLYARYTDEWELCDTLGINIMVNEHHSAATCLTACCHLTLAILARTTKRVRLLSLGTPLANRRDPVRVAEEIAMVDCYSGGRYEVGFVRGGPFEVWPANSQPVGQVRRFDEAYRLVMKALTTHDRPFSWQGRYYHERLVNIWPRPVQQPHPPLWFVSIGPGPGAWIAEQGGTVGTFLTGRDSKLLFDTYRRRSIALGRGMPAPEKLAYMGIVAVAETEARAKERAHAIAGYIRTAPQLAPRFLSPPGYVPTRAAAQAIQMSTDPNYVPAYASVVMRDGSRVHQRAATIDQLIDAHVVFAGTPEQVYHQIKDYHAYVGGFGNLLMMGHGGALGHVDTVQNLTLFSREVLPRLQDLPPITYELPPG
ncbi:MAG TPA: LLM class flavin-dependent oxidoreductase [Candidatus Binataceae bacterium]|nr:LLM class flavin-dependent oxidoreductase [Candidatus Binataceae bacterium]